MLKNKAETKHMGLNHGISSELGFVSNILSFPSILCLTSEMAT